MTDNKGQVNACIDYHINQVDTCPPMGTCYDMDDARRALADRPSMERELAELRQWKADIEQQHRAIMAEECTAGQVHCTCVSALRYEMEACAKLCADLIVAKGDLEAERDRLRAALREIVELTAGTAGRTEHRCIDCGCLVCRACRIARAALETKGGNERVD